MYSINSVNDYGSSFAESWSVSGSVDYSVVLFGSTGYKKAYDLQSLSPAFSKCNPPEDVGVEI